MKITCHEELKARPELLSLTEEATAILEDVLGSSTRVVTAEWGHRVDAQGRDRVLLRLSDWAGSQTAEFAPEELKSSSQLVYRFHRLWGDVLQIRSHKQLEALTAAENASEGVG